jgi:hypothetical protein
MTDKFVIFSFPAISTYLNKEGIEKKKPMKMPPWQDIKQTTIKKADKAYAVICGKLSNITVLDFDDKSVYQKMLTDHPDLENCYTVESRNGYHLYFQYNETVNTTTNGLINYAKVDIRNDDSIIFAPPTKYTLLNGDIAKYKYRGGEIMDFPDYLLSELKQNEAKPTKSIKQTTGNTELEVVKPVERLPLKLLEALVNLLDAKRADDYQSWLVIGLILYRYNNSKECLKLWDSFSQKSKKYEKNCCLSKWNSFNKDYSKITIGTLKYFARTDNKEGYEKLMDMFDEQDHFATFDVHQRYILAGEHENTIKKMLKKWYRNETEKVLAVKSAYDTGKTRTLHYLIEKVNPTKILFITYRQTLSHNFFGSFKNFNVGNYLDGDYKSPRLICQVESLPKLLQINYFDNTLIVPKYDLIIMDECESVLNHTESPTIKTKSKTFTVMDAILKKAGKIIALDGDFANRSYDYFKSVNGNTDFTVIRNTMVPYVKTWKFTNDREKFDEKILKCLQNKQKIFICSMSSEQALYYQDKLQGYKVLVHSSKSDDTLKTKLQNVNALWVQYDVVIVTPTVESGVDFNVPHFHKMFAILSSGSTSQRGLANDC